MEEKSVLAPCSRDCVGCDFFLIRPHDYRQRLPGRLRRARAWKPQAQWRDKGLNG
jgi:hypothetical protein